MTGSRGFAVAICALLLGACTITTGAGRDQSPAASTRDRAETPTPAPKGQPVDPQTAQRLKRIFVPILASMNRPRSPSEVKVAIVDDPHINAGSAGSGEFLVTTGLLQKASDEQLAAVLAHEAAHDDLGHVARTQALGAGVSIGVAILDQLIPGSRALTPIAGTLLLRQYSQSEEYAADRHGVEILRRVGMPKEAMINTLEWLRQQEGSSKGGFFATHPATGERIEALRNMR